MNQQHRAKFNWYKLLGALAIFSGTIGAIESRPATATISYTKGSLDAHSIVSSLERPTELTKPNYSSLDNTSQLIARHGHHRRFRHFGGHHRGFRHGHHRRFHHGHRRRFRHFGGHHRGFHRGHHRRFRRFGGHHRGFRH